MFCILSPLLSTLLLLLKFVKIGRMNQPLSKKFKVSTLGCRTNQYESQAYQDQLLALGYTQAQAEEVADVCIVNTCTVTESADSASRHEIRQLARQNPGSKLVVTGCYAERQPEKIQQIEGVTHVVPNRNKDQLLATLFPDQELPEFNIKHFDAHTRAFVKVQDGCDSFCTYCILPYVRGRSRSRSLADILPEVEGLIANGFKEIVLTGINIGDFEGPRSDGESPHCLADLVRAVDQVPGLERLRVSSIDPDEVDDNLMDAILNGRTTCHSMHIVLQSGSNVILKKMNRKYTRQIFMDTVDRLRSADSDFTFTTDIIVGFPGETEIDFNETLAVMDEVHFAKVHMFPYSSRPRTRAALYPDPVPFETMKSRKQEVLRRSEQQAFVLRQRFLSRQLWVLTESQDSSKPHHVLGHTENFLQVSLAGDFSPNELVEVELIDNTPAGLIGRAVNSSAQRICG
jgi:threonylcarbamoyladenosine tRNA methylthiotransferase MtaB